MSRLTAMARGGLLRMWASRGGGFYGLGYVLVFVYFEIDLLLEDLVESETAAGFALGQLLERLLRFGLLSFLNAFQALLWPFYVLQYLGGAGIVLLVGAYFAFERVLKPIAGGWFPELADYRLERETRSSRAGNMDDDAS